MIGLDLLWNFYFWLFAIAGILIFVEAAKKNSLPLLSRYTAQDLFWFFFNSLAFGFIFNWIFVTIAPTLFYTFSGWLSGTLSYLSLAVLPFYLQFILLLLIQDFIEWSIHYALHNVPPLWQIHKLHHSIERMNWFGNFRFHWLEILVYKTVKYIPLLVIAPSYQIAFAVGIFGVLIGNLNHLSIPFQWQPKFLRYILNSAGFHIWHHRVPEQTEEHGVSKFARDRRSLSARTVNYAITFAFWDYLFGTAYNPQNEIPPQLGLVEAKEYPSSIIQRFTYPFTRFFHRSQEQE